MALFKPWRYLVSKPPNLDVAKEARILCDVLEVSREDVELEKRLVALIVVLVRDAHGLTEVHSALPKQFSLHYLALHLLRHFPLKQI